MVLNDDEIRFLLQGNKEWSFWCNPLKTLLPQYDINTVSRIAGFMAQCGHESLNFKVLSENLNYSAKGLNAVFPKYFKKAGRNAEEYHRNPELIANVVYANRMGNGPPNSGDGYLFRGRGVIQITGKNNYNDFAASVGITLAEAIDYVQTKQGALESACWYWDMRNINVTCDRQDIKKMTKLINGGTIGLEDRKHHFVRALGILGGDYSPSPRPTLIKVGSEGDKVAAIQGVLNLSPDGYFGKLTEAAVISWQAKNGLTPDGIVGPKTYQKMLA